MPRHLRENLFSSCPSALRHPQVHGTEFFNVSCVPDVLERSGAVSLLALTVPTSTTIHRNSIQLFLAFSTVILLFRKVLWGAEDISSTSPRRLEASLAAEFISGNSSNIESGDHMEMKTCVSEFLRLRRRQQGLRCQTHNVSRFASNDVFLWEV